MSSHAFKTSDTSHFYIHVGSYISQLFVSNDFPDSLCYNFPCIRGCLESLWREVPDIYNLNCEVGNTAYFFVYTMLHQFEYSLIY